MSIKIKKKSSENIKKEILTNKIMLFISLNMMLISLIFYVFTDEIKYFIAVLIFAVMNIFFNNDAEINRLTLEIREVKEAIKNK